MMNVDKFRDFQESTGEESIPQEIIEQILESPKFTEKVTSLIEGHLASNILQAKIQSVALDDDPFDAIYLAKLALDPIKPDEIQQINKFRNIEDSETIHFDDGWDD